MGQDIVLCEATECLAKRTELDKMAELGNGVVTEAMLGSKYHEADGALISGMFQLAVDPCR
jgi:hypothetical protein